MHPSQVELVGAQRQRDLLQTAARRRLARASRPQPGRFLRMVLRGLAPPADPGFPSLTLRGSGETHSPLLDGSTRSVLGPDVGVAEALVAIGAFRITHGDHSHDMHSGSRPSR